MAASSGGHLQKDIPACFWQRVLGWASWDKPCRYKTSRAWGTTSGVFPSHNLCPPSQTSLQTRDLQAVPWPSTSTRDSRYNWGPVHKVYSHIATKENWISNVTLAFRTIHLYLPSNLQNYCILIQLENLNRRHEIELAALLNICRFSPYILIINK